MKAIPFIPAPSPTKTQVSTKPQTSRSGGKDAFAPILSKAVTSKKTASDSQRKGYSQKTANHDQKDVAGKKTTSKSNQSVSAQTSASDNNKPTSVNAPKTALGKSNKGQQSATAQQTHKTSLKEENTSEDVKTTTSKSSHFILGLLGYLFNIQKNISSETLEKNAEILSNKFGIGQQESLNILKNIAALDKSTSFGSNIMKALAADPKQDEKLQEILKSLSDTTSDPEEDLTALLKSILQKTNATQSQITSNASNSQAIASSSSSLTQDTQNVLPVAQSKSDQSLVAQQLQKILSAGDGGKPVQIHVQSGQQNRTDGLNSLSSPLLTSTDKQDSQSQAVTGTAASVISASLTKAAAPEETVKAKHSAGLEKNLDHSFFIKSEDLNPKDQVTVEAKDAGLQNSDSQKQTASASTTDTSGTTLQTGLFSFSSTLNQSMQTSFHTTGTTAQTHFTSWTISQEHAIVNQVMQRFHISSNSPSSKLVVKLYPEELGELKIDIQMNDGVIKANIVTQTQQVQQVLEKYLPKLKTFMEQQGLSVDDILVTNTSDNVGGHELFQDDFVGNNDFSPPGKSQHPVSLNDITFDKAFTDIQEDTTGVNVTV